MLRYVPVDQEKDIVVRSSQSTRVSPMIPEDRARTAIEWDRRHFPVPFLFDNGFSVAVTFDDPSVLGTSHGHRYTLVDVASLKHASLPPQPSYMSAVHTIQQLRCMHENCRATPAHL